MLRSLAGGALFGEVWGEGPARVLLLHGWARTHADFAGAFGPGTFEEAPAVVAVDLPGFGATPPPPEAWGTTEYAAALEPLFGAEIAPPAVVVGHSFGGRVAVALAAARPDLVGALVLTGVPLLPRGARRRRPPLGYRAVRAANRLHLVGAQRLERARRRYGSPDYRDAQGVMRSVLVRVVGERYDEQLEALRCPVELVWSDDDGEAPWSIAEQVAKRLDGAVLTSCPGAGHLTPLSAPGPLREAVERALAGA